MLELSRRCLEDLFVFFLFKAFVWPYYGFFEALFGRFVYFLKPLFGLTMPCSL